LALYDGRSEAHVKTLMLKHIYEYAG